MNMNSILIKLNNIGFLIRRNLDVIYFRVCEQLTSQNTKDMQNLLIQIDTKEWNGTQLTNEEKLAQELLSKQCKSSENKKLFFANLWRWLPSTRI